MIAMALSVCLTHQGVCHECLFVLIKSIAHKWATPVKYYSQPNQKYTKADLSILHPLTLQYINQLQSVGWSQNMVSDIKF